MCKLVAHIGIEEHNTKTMQGNPFAHVSLGHVCHNPVQQCLMASFPGNSCQINMVHDSWPLKFTEISS